MSAAVQDFISAARIVHDDDTHRITSGGQNTIMKMCLNCGLMAPHVLTVDGTRCVICGHETVRASHSMDG